MRTLPLIIGFALVSTAIAAAPGQVAYPNGYRDWRHVKSMVIEPGHALANPFEGIHHVYVNEIGEAALRTGGELPNGSVLVFDLLEAKRADHAIAEGPRKLVGVMVKDEARFASTGGWGFEGFAGDSTDQRLVTDGGASCFACHEARKDHDHVFSAWRQ